MSKNFLDLPGLTTYDGKIKEYISAHSGGGNTDIIAADYDSTATYAVGDYCVYNNELYRCTTAITTAEAWNSSHWSSTNVDSELDSKMNTKNPVGTGSFSLNRRANTTVGDYSFTEGNGCAASGSRSHAEGYGTTASGRYSHAEGQDTTASGNYSCHAEGCVTTASGDYGSHAEGYYTTASGRYSHAEGNNTTASANHSHAEGYYTTAQRKSQHVFGEYNVLDTTGADGTVKGTYVEIVGNGTGTSARSNARTLDWNGNETLAGRLFAVDQPQETISSTEPSGQNNGDYWLQAYTP